LRVPRIAAAILLLAVFAVGGRAQAETRRLAILVGNNAGSGRQPALRFAEDDAERLASVLAELGAFDRQDLWVLKGAGTEPVRAALDEATRRVASWRTRPDRQAVVLFYFSGHSDGQAIELGHERLAFTDVRRLLAGTGADVRLAILDSCHAGGLLAAKGGAPGQAFEVHLSDNLASAGEAFITSSTADEAALESSELRGSFFSHHLISGLRGAADVSGDGQVTLVEAYQYAYGRTVSTSATTTIGLQHPVYDYRLSGQGDLVLTRLDASAALIETPAGFDRVLLVDPRSSDVLVELGSRAARRVALPPGRYVLLGWRDGGSLRAEVVLRPGESRLVAAAEFRPTLVAQARRKGAEADLNGSVDSAAESRGSQDAGLGIMVGLGAEGGAAAASLSLLPSLRVSASGGGPRTLTLALGLASARGPTFRESRAELLLGGEQRWTSGRWRAGVGLEAGGGVGVQGIDGQAARSSALLTVAATGSLVASLTPSLGLALQMHMPATFFRREGETAAAWQPAAWLGVMVRP
jgi:hypothetical protein